MKLKKCENGHFYDEEKYAFCPHCKREKAPAGDNDFTISLTSDFPSDKDGKEDALTEPLTEPLSSLKKEVEKVQREADLTVGFYSQKIGVEPVVGWLVCTQGDQRGKSFELHEGRNFIGRGNDMDVILSKDTSVSRNKHAILVYESRNKMFLAQAGESRELFYVNDEVVLSHVKLKAYDVLLVGNTKLVFVPFCGDEYAWE